MGWTERKTGFTDSVPPGISNMGFRAGQREDIGNLSTITTVMPKVDGNDALMKTFAEKFRKVIHTPRPEEFGTEPVLVYLGPNNDFSEYTMEDIQFNSKKYWWSHPQYVLNFAGKVLLVLPCPKRKLTDEEVSSIKKFLVNRRVVIFVGEDTAIANEILVQLGSQLQYFQITPALTANDHIISGKFPDGTALWVPGAYRCWVGVAKGYWPEAVVKDLYGFGLAYDKITSVCPWWRGYGKPTVGLYIDQWWPRYGYYFFSSLLLQTPSWPFFVLYWGGLISYYTTAYIDFVYSDILITDFQPWISANIANMPMYWINAKAADPASFYQHTNFKYGYYWNYQEAVTTPGIYTGSSCAYRDGENIVVAGFKPSWLSKSLLGMYTDLAKTMKIREFSRWLAYGKLTLAPNLFNTKNFIMPLPYTYWASPVDGTGEVIQGP